MGKAKNQAKERKRKEKLKLENERKPFLKKLGFPEKLKAELDKLFDPEKLTTPIEINEDISKFCNRISSFDPFFIFSTPEEWSRQSCCNQNVKEYIRLNGGNIVCGYKIWYNSPIYIEEERHAIWELNGVYKDISFNADGETRILFLPDVLEKQTELEQNKQKIRWGSNWKVRLIIEKQEEMEQLANIQQMSDEESWNAMLRYEQWKTGDRISNLVQKKIG